MKKLIKRDALAIYHINNAEEYFVGIENLNGTKIKNIITEEAYDIKDATKHGINYHMFSNHMLSDNKIYDIKSINFKLFCSNAIKYFKEELKQHERNLKLENDIKKHTEEEKNF